MNKLSKLIGFPSAVAAVVLTGCQSPLHKGVSYNEQRRVEISRDIAYNDNLAPYTNPESFWEEVSWLSCKLKWIPSYEGDQNFSRLGLESFNKLMAVDENETYENFCLDTRDTLRDLVSSFCQCRTEKATFIEALADAEILRAQYGMDRGFNKEAWELYLGIRIDQTAIKILHSAEVANSEIKDAIPRTIESVVSEWESEHGGEKLTQPGRIVLICANVQEGQSISGIPALIENITSCLVDKNQRLAGIQRGNPGNPMLKNHQLVKLISEIPQAQDMSIQ